MSTGNAICSWINSWLNTHEMRGERQASGILSFSLASAHLRRNIHPVEGDWTIIDL